MILCSVVSSFSSFRLKLGSWSFSFVFRFWYMQGRCQKRLIVKIILYYYVYYEILARYEFFRRKAKNLICRNGWGRITKYCFPEAKFVISPVFWFPGSRFFLSAACGGMTGDFFCPAVRFWARPRCRAQCFWPGRYRLPRISRN